jgi:hypothetical protein
VLWQPNSNKLSFDRWEFTLKLNCQLVFICLAALPLKQLARFSSMGQFKLPLSGQYVLLEVRELCSTPTCFALVFLFPLCRICSWERRHPVLAVMCQRRGGHREPSRLFRPQILIRICTPGGSLQGYWSIRSAFHWCSHRLKGNDTHLTWTWKLTSVCAGCGVVTPAS